MGIASVPLFVGAAGGELNSSITARLASLEGLRCSAAAHAVSARAVVEPEPSNGDKRMAVAVRCRRADEAAPTLRRAVERFQ